MGHGVHTVSPAVLDMRHPSKSRRKLRQTHPDDHICNAAQKAVHTRRTNYSTLSSTMQHGSVTYPEDQSYANAAQGITYTHRISPWYHVQCCTKGISCLQRHCFFSVFVSVMQQKKANHICTIRLSTISSTEQHDIIIIIYKAAREARHPHKVNFPALISTTPRLTHKLV